ncbi:MAG TPA: hypothetical protein VIP07_10110 [Candidatus Limnocylindria bacterium]
MAGVSFHDGTVMSGTEPATTVEAGYKRIATTQIEGVDIMCMNCGCGKNEERHKPTDITLSDLTAAAKGHDMEVEKAADNIHDGARALKKSGKIS